MVHRDPETGRATCSNCDEELIYDFWWGICPECGGVFSETTMKKKLNEKTPSKGTDWLTEDIK